MLTERTTAAPPAHETVASLFEALLANVERVIQGKREAVHLGIIALLAGGHILIEDVPGVGKTSLAKAIASSIGGSWHRIQFTPDLLPSDVTGVSVWNRATSQFEFRPGGIFANVVLADEINRASPKTQSALLEAMEEQQVTVDQHTHRLGSPFIVMATQNPIELEGTFPLPEAQLDRFLMRIAMGYPDRDAELRILRAQGEHLRAEDLQPVASAESIVAAMRAIDAVHIAPALQGYIVDVVEVTRNNRDLVLGVSPRGALALQRSSRALAATVGRDYVVPDDITLLAPAVLAHRIIVSPDAQMRGLTANEVLHGALSAVPVPGPAVG
jgi:MoxR-like ATPase